MTEKKSLRNYHTHTYRCGHAKGDFKDYCEKAVELGFDTLGFTDHTPLYDDWQGSIRMREAELPQYIKGFQEAKTKYTSLHLLLGLECDFKTEYINYFNEYLKGEMGIEYLTGSIHYYLYQNKYLYVRGEHMNHEQFVNYAESYVKAIESGCFRFVNHPDLFGQSIGKWDAEAEACSKYILEAASACKVPIELNTSGFAKAAIHPESLSFPLEQFWEMASDYDIEVIVNTDAHTPEALAGNLERGEEFVARYDLKRIYL